MSSTRRTRRELNEPEYTTTTTSSRRKRGARVGLLPAAYAGGDSARTITTLVSSETDDERDRTTLDGLALLYGGAIFAKRRKRSAPSGRWFAVMFARNRETETACHTERTRICYTAHIGSLFVAECSGDGSASAAMPPFLVEPEDDARRRWHARRRNPASGGADQGDIASRSNEADKKPKSLWKVVLALGPIGDERIVSNVCRLWSLSKKGVINKAARGEAISERLGIPGYVDWSGVFGSAERLAKRFQIAFYKSPDGEGVCI